MPTEEEEQLRRKLAEEYPDKSPQERERMMYAIMQQQGKLHRKGMKRGK